MKKNEFCLYLSQGKNQEAAKEISLKIKSDFHQNPKFIFILFTPNYSPQDLLQTFIFTLKTSNLLGIKAPFLIYKDKIIEKGVIGCCVNKEGAEFDIFFAEPKDLNKIKEKFKQNLEKKNSKLISFLSPQINPIFFLEKLRLSLGKLTNISGVGFEKESSSSQCFMFKTSLANGLMNLNAKGIKTENICLHNFIPLGKPFNITKLNFHQQIIEEINGSPAIEIYKHYLEEKFTDFIQNRLFSYYPLGVLDEGAFRLLTITDTLEDGSLLFKGNLRYKTVAHIMVLKEVCSQENIANQLRQTDKNENGVAFVTASLSRKKNLGKLSEREIKNIREAFYPKKEIFGVFSDYYFFSDPRKQNASLESGGLLINVWE